MERRGFLKSLVGLASALAFDPEKALWVPGKRKIFIPPAPKAEHINWELEREPMTMTWSAGWTYTLSAEEIARSYSTGTPLVSWIYSK